MTRICIILFWMAFTLSCKEKEKEEKCVAPAIQNHLVGEWTAGGTLFGAPFGPARLDFTQFGDLEGNVEIFSEEGNEIAAPVTWTTENGNVVISVDYGSGNIMEFVLPVLENECDQIRMGEEEVLYLELKKP